MRQREIAIRLALGAERSAILGWTGWQVARLVIVGIAIGMFGSWPSSRWLSTMVFGISERNPATMLWAILAVMGTAALGAGVPMWRATRVNALRSLREG